MAQAGRTIKHYHANNGRFSDNGFFNTINKKYQKLKLCGVGAHHQNVIIDNKNKILTTGSRTILLPGIIMWHQTIDEIFLQFSIKIMVERLNSLQINLKGRTPESIFNGVEVEVILVKYYHTLFFPIYVLNVRLQSAGYAGPPKWEPRFCIVLYLGHS